MINPDNSITSLFDWLGKNRSETPLLNIEADSRLTGLASLSMLDEHRAALHSAPLTLGLWGSSVRGKYYLLNKLMRSSTQWSQLALGNHTPDYLTHINPGLLPHNLAVRFTRQRPLDIPGYPLRLKIYTEMALLQKIITDYHARPDAIVLPHPILSARLRTLAQRLEPGPNEAVSRREFAAVIHQTLSARYGVMQLDETQVWQLAEIASRLGEEDRCTLFSLFWGDDPHITQLWKQSAAARAVLGNATEVMAPESLVLNPFISQEEGFLFAATAEQHADTPLTVCPLVQNIPQPSVAIAQSTLAALCKEVVFTLRHAEDLPDIDIVDIPERALASYASALQPDALIVCNAVEALEDAPQAADRLSHWLNQSGGCKGASPRLVWAITPYNPRLKHQHDPDAEIKRKLSRTRQRWGTLLVLEETQPESLSTWLHQTLNQESRQERLAYIQNYCREAVSQHVSSRLFGKVNSTGEPFHIIELVRTLQTQGARLGHLPSLMALSRAAIAQCWDDHHDSRCDDAILALPDLDLFADESEQSATRSEEKTFASRVYQRWVVAIRQCSYQPALAGQLRITQAQFALLCDLIIVCSYEQNLQARLEQALQSVGNHKSLAITCASHLLNEFISWLGYDCLPPEQRPASRINKGMPVFAATSSDTETRIDKLAPEAQTGRSLYIYDWLVAFYHRAMACSRGNTAIPEEKQDELTQLLAVTDDKQ